MPMNRNHQGRNDQKRTKQGRHHVAYNQLGRSYQRPEFDRYEKQYGNYRYAGAREDDQRYNFDEEEWESQFNRPPTSKRRFQEEKHLNQNQPRDYTSDEGLEEEVSYSRGYQDFHRGGEPQRVVPREKYRHERVQNASRNFHGHDLSYRARNEHHPERFMGESKRSYAGIGPKNYQRSDSSLEEEVCEVLTRDALIDASEIIVAVENGTVKLSGSVENREERFAIERAVDGIWGVEDIMNDIKVIKRH